MVNLKMTNNMPEDTQVSIDLAQVKEMLNQKKGRMKACLSACAGCSLCAESCFLFMGKDQDPRYMPSYKVLNSLGTLYRKRGKLSPEQWEEANELVHKNCALCGRCYCPFGIDIPNMISFARTILRSQGICGVFPYSMGAPEDDYKPAIVEDVVEDKARDEG